MKRFLSILFFLGIIIGIGVHVRVALFQPLFGDEISSIFFARSNSFSQLLSQRVEVIHPNTFYILIKVLMEMGVSPTGLRLIQVCIFCISTIPLIGILKSFGYTKYKILAGVTAWVFSAYFLHYMYLIRMYGLAITVVLFSIYVSIRFLHKPTLLTIISLLIADLFGISLVSSYWIWIVIQYSALTLYMLRYHRSSIWMKVITGIMIVFFGWFVITAFNVSKFKTNISTQFLYWVPIPQVTDILHMPAVLFGIASPSYYEAYTLNHPSLGIIFLFFVCLTTLIYISRSSKQERETKQHKYFLYFKILCMCSLSLYTAIFFACYFFSLPFFHVRQLFPFAVVLFLAVYILVFSAYEKHKILTFFIIIPILLLGGRRIVLYAGGNYSIYPQRYENRPTHVPVFFTRSDIELIYDVCTATSFYEMKEKCSAVQLFLAEGTPDLLQQLGTMQEKEVAVTSTAKNLIPIDSNWKCNQASIDYYHCVVTQNENENVN